MKIVYYDVSTSIVSGFADIYDATIPEMTGNLRAIEVSEFPALPCYISNNEFFPLPEQPSPYHTFANYTWLLSDMEGMKAAAILGVNRRKLEEETSGIHTSFGLFDSDSVSIQKLMGRTLIAPMLGETVDWRLRDNSEVTLTNAELSVVAVEIAVEIERLHQKYAAIKDEIRALSDESELMIKYEQYKPTRSTIRGF